MKKLIYVIPVLAFCVIGWRLAVNDAKPNARPQILAEVQTKIIVAAANDFLNSLSDRQRDSTQFEFLRPKTAMGTHFDMSKMPGGAGRPGGPPNGGTPVNGDTSHRPPMDQGGKGGPPASGEQYGKAIWSNFPVSITQRPGIELGSLNAKQMAAATHLLQVILSAKGYEKVQQIMGSDEALAQGGTDFLAGKGHYLIGIFGKPDMNKPWMVEFGGHHLGLNIVIAGSKGALTPTLTGAQPAIYTENGKTIRVLAQENDQAFALLGTFTDNQRKKAILNYKVNDLVLGPGHDGQTIIPEGLKASEMTVQQRQMLTGLIAEWAGIINNAYLKEHMDAISAGLGDTYFAWSGPITHAAGKNGTSYYRIQGPDVIIEFSPQSTFGNPDMHVHTIYRDPANEYGSAYQTQ